MDMLQANKWAFFPICEPRLAVGKPFPADTGGQFMSTRLETRSVGSPKISSHPFCRGHTP
jgi:hypothetical protein